MKDKVFSLTYVDSDVLKREAEFPNLDVIDLAINLFKYNNSINSLYYAIKASFAKLYRCSDAILQAEADLAEQRYVSSVLNYLSFVAYQTKQPPTGWESVSREERICWLDLYELKNKLHRIEILGKFRKECLIAGVAAPLADAPVTVTTFQGPAHLSIRAEVTLHIPEDSCKIIYAESVLDNITLNHTQDKESLIKANTDHTVKSVKSLLDTELRTYASTVVASGEATRTAWPDLNRRYFNLS